MAQTRANSKTTLAANAHIRLRVISAGITRKKARRRSVDTYVAAASLYLLREIMVISRTVPINMKTRYAPMTGMYRASARLLIQLAIASGFTSRPTVQATPLMRSIDREFNA